MDACPLLITSIVAVKPEDQGTFFQDFLGLSGYLCSVPEMHRTTMKPNGCASAAASASIKVKKARISCAQRSVACACWTASQDHSGDAG